MRSERGKTILRCAVYTRVSTEHGLEQEFNSLDNQREASEAYVKSQAHEGWKLIRTHYDDGGYSGGSMDRPALKRLLDDVRARRIDVIVVYKVDRLTRSLADFAKLVELFDAHQVSFVSVTQAFNTTTSMGRLTRVARPTLKGATAQKVASKLISAGFVKEVKAKASDPIWRRDEESGASYALKLTAAGAKAIAVDDAPEPEDAGEASDALANRDQAAILSKLDAKDARPAEGIEPCPIRRPAPRGGSKLARV